MNREALPEPSAAEVLADLRRLRRIDEWHEDTGDVLWWTNPVCEPPYCGGPNDGDWPGHHEYWTPLLLPVTETTP